MSYNSYYNTKTGYDLEPNFAFEANKYADPYAKIKGVGCAGTNEGYLASKSEFVEPPYITGGMRNNKRSNKRSNKRNNKRSNKRSISKTYIGGSNGYEFTDVPIAPVAGPGAPYSEIKSYNTTTGNYRAKFPSEFKGGRKHMQYGCNKKRLTKRLAKRNLKSKRMLTAKRNQTAKRMAKLSASRRWMMYGGLNSASDYTVGRDASQDQPYSNKAISFGQGLNSTLNAGESALASPPPFLPYNDCGKVNRV